MISLEAVVEVPGFGREEAPPWPVASLPAFSWLRLHAGCTDGEVGLFVAALTPRRGAAPLGDFVGRLLDEEVLIAAGGLRLADISTAAVVAPGCCAGLEDWREWISVFHGEPPWLGHDPSPRIEVIGDALHVWPDAAQPAGPKIVVPGGMLPDLLAAVHRDLVGFLGALEAWTVRAGLGERGAALVAAVDRDFRITPPLGAGAVS